MRSRLIDLVIAALTSIAMTPFLPTPARSQIEYDHMRGEGKVIQQAEVAPGVYQFTTLRDSYVRMLNSTAVITDRDVLVFDTDTRPSTARLILALIRRITKKPVRYVVNSHGHPDHWSGNMVYADAFPDLDIIATERIREFMQATEDTWPRRFTTELANRRTALAAKGDSATRQDSTDVVDYASFTQEATTLRRVLPTVTFTDSMTFRHGGREFRFLSVTGDQEGTTVLYLPRDRVLLTGDAVSYPIPYVSNKLHQHAATLRMLADLHAAVIVPGHGPAFHDNAFIDLERQLIEAVIDGVAKARANGVQSVEDLQRTVTIDELREPFAHGDPDLEQRYTARVKALVGFAAAE